MDRYVEIKQEFEKWLLKMLCDLNRQFIVDIIPESYIRVKDTLIKTKLRYSIHIDDTSFVYGEIYRQFNNSEFKTKYSDSDYIFMITSFNHAHPEIDKYGVRYNQIDSIEIALYKKDEEDIDDSNKRT